MQKNVKSVRTLVSQYQTNCERISAIADACEQEKRERSDAETAEFAALTRDNQLLQMRMQAVAVEQTKVFEAAKFFAKQETILPAPESAHAILVAIDEAKKCRETGEAKTIVFGLTGTGYFDMTAYTSYNEDTMKDYIPSDEELKKGFDQLPDVI